ncbi:hypothetical protein U472_03450 [Orenia metallireducens]|uniref:Sulfotransferase domain-containing protein n=1 Tax=Orenia metallireducens TaxID=1413210 RepID=A0A1C0AB64_9FIRM|nr:sulfotransferase [Orenia metallireducens]OCL27619.1 hypothetical protein U472_03450 [Orenia metallireducens]
MAVDFIIVGAMKAGTTSLAFHLNNHPDIYIPQRELHFFDNEDNYKRGYKYYLSLFEYEGEKVVGEKTPTYSYLDKVAERIYKFNPNLKIIWIFRNPIDRAYSNYWHAVEKGAEYLSFSKAIKKEPNRIKTDIWKGYLKRSIYVEQVERYLQFFNKEQMLFLLFEDFMNQPERELKKICNFVNVNADKFEYIEEIRNKTTVPRSKIILWLFRKIFGYKSRLYNITYKLNTFGKKAGYPALSNNIRLELREYFSDYNNQLEELTGLDLSVWNG